MDTQLGRPYVLPGGYYLLGPPAATATGAPARRSVGSKEPTLPPPAIPPAPPPALPTPTPLTLTAPHLLSDGRNEYPVVEGIPYLIAESTRPGLEDACARACAHLRAGDERAALRLLLRDQDRFSPTAPPSEAAVDELLDRREELTLREAMALLNYGPVADYFAHRWSSPTFQSGMALLERASHPSRPVVEVACGIGHFLRHLEGAGYACLGVDIVFSKLWLARHFLWVKGPLACADIERSPVFAPVSPDAVAARPHTAFCHDAFYFFEDKPAAYAHLTAVARSGNVVLGHVHTRTDAHEAGFAERLTTYRDLLPDGARLVDDLDLAYSYVSGKRDLRDVTVESTAFAVTSGEPVEESSTYVPPRASLRLNPLLKAEGIDFPSESWRREFEEDSQRMGRMNLAAFAKTRRVRALVTGENAIARLGDEELDSLYRHRVLLNLPQRW